MNTIIKIKLEFMAETDIYKAAKQAIEITERKIL